MWLTRASVGACLLRGLMGSYIVADDYTASSFFDQWHFFDNAVDGPDPTNGVTNYVNMSTANAKGYISSQDGKYYVGLDASNITTRAQGRNAVRLESLQTYDHGLFILDLEHMPGGICGTWPSWWLYGGDGPAPQPAGEMDIIEQANDAATNEMTLHVYDNKGHCKVSNETADVQYGVYGDRLLCSDNQAGTEGGCAVDDLRNGSFGKAFNDNGGGVYAAEWTTGGLNVWFWGRDLVPSGDSGPLGSSPDPASAEWGQMAATFQGASCDFPRHFHQQQMIINTALCGDWAGELWNSSQYGCSHLAPTCDDYVLSNPAAFKDAYWTINSLKVFQNNATDENLGSSLRVVHGGLMSRSIKWITMILCLWLTG